MKICYFPEIITEIKGFLNNIFISKSIFLSNLSFFSAISFKKISFDNTTQAIHQLNITGTNTLETSLNDREKRMQCAAICNAKNTAAWDCNAFYFEDQTTCKTGFMALEFAADMGHDTLAGSGDQLNVFYVRF